MIDETSINTQGISSKTNTSSISNKSGTNWKTGVLGSRPILRVKFDGKNYN